MELRVWKNKISDLSLCIANTRMWKCNLQQDMSSGQNLALVECDSSLDWFNQTQIRVKILRHCSLSRKTYSHIQKSHGKWSKEANIAEEHRSRKKTVKAQLIGVKVKKIFIFFPRWMMLHHLLWLIKVTGVIQFLLLMYFANQFI